MDPASALDNAILTTGKATIGWLRAQGVPVATNETASHVAWLAPLADAPGVWLALARPKN